MIHGLRLNIHNSSKKIPAANTAAGDKSIFTSGLMLELLSFP
jgi:hypothetical protein